MDSDFTLFAVDDVEFARVLLDSAFRQECRIESFASAEDCLARLDQPGSSPDLFLLDVDLPGINGYELCRRIKARPAMLNVPVIFLSGFDDADSRLEGYDAGGIDYVVKLYNLAELKKKVEVARRLSGEHRSLSGKVQESELLASLVMSNLDEYAALIHFLRALNACEAYPAMLDALFDLLHAYRLQGAIQIRLPGFEKTIGENGEDYPLEVSVMQHVRKLDRIFEFKKRAAYNYEHITILVNNVPVHDPDLCGRIRDNLLIATECANARLQAMQTKADHVHARESMFLLLNELQDVVQDFEKKYTLARYRGSALTLEILNELAMAFSSLGMTDEQEAGIQNIINDKAYTLAEIYDFSSDTQEALGTIAAHLSAILSGTAEVEKPPPAPLDSTRQSGGSGVEFF